MEYNDDPLFRYSDEELMNMTIEEFCTILEERNDYVDKKHSQINEQVAPKFNTIEEFRAYYKCMPLDDAVNKLYKLLEK